MTDIVIMLGVIGLACGFICVLGTIEWAGRRLIDWMTGP